jgi:hypothetical protein
MQVVWTLQKASCDLEATERASMHRDWPVAMNFYWLILLSQPPTKRPMQVQKRSSRRQANLSRHYCDPGALSGVVKGSSLESTTKTASKLADSLSLAFSLTL